MTYGGDVTSGDGGGGVGCTRVCCTGGNRRAIHRRCRVDRGPPTSATRGPSARSRHCRATLDASSVFSSSARSPAFPWRTTRWIAGGRHCAGGGGEADPRGRRRARSSSPAARRPQARADRGGSRGDPRLRPRATAQPEHVETLTAHHAAQMRKRRRAGDAASKRDREEREGERDGRRLGSRAPAVPNSVTPHPRVLGAERAATAPPPRWSSPDRRASPSSSAAHADRGKQKGRTRPGLRASASGAQRPPAQPKATRLTHLLPRPDFASKPRPPDRRLGVRLRARIELPNQPGSRLGSVRRVGRSQCECSGVRCRADDCVTSGLRPPESGKRGGADRASSVRRRGCVLHAPYLDPACRAASASGAGARGPRRQRPGAVGIARGGTPGSAWSVAWNEFHPRCDHCRPPGG